MKYTYFNKTNMSSNTSSKNDGWIVLISFIILFGSIFLAASFSPDYPRKIEHEGHTYIEFSSKKIVHDPKCIERDNKNK